MEQWFNQFGAVSVNPLFLAVLSLWSVAWKGVGLWKARGNNQLYWFLALLVLNTVGIAEIIYIKFFQVKRTDKREWPWGLGKFFQGGKS